MTSAQSCLRSCRLSLTVSVCMAAINNHVVSILLPLLATTRTFVFEFEFEIFVYLFVRRIPSATNDKLKVNS